VQWSGRPLTNCLLLTRTTEVWESCMADHLVNRLRLGFLDHLGVRKHIIRDNIRRASIEVTDVTALKISESV
jgi:hypothetical protein